MQRAEQSLRTITTTGDDNEEQQALYAQLSSEALTLAAQLKELNVVLSSDTTLETDTTESLLVEDVRKTESGLSEVSDSLESSNDDDRDALIQQQSVLRAHFADLNKALPHLQQQTSTLQRTIANASEVLTLLEQEATTGKTSSDLKDAIAQFQTALTKNRPEPGDCNGWHLSIFALIVHCSC